MPRKTRLGYLVLILFCALPVPFSVYLLAFLPPNPYQAALLGAGAVLCSALQFALSLRIIQLSWVERLKLLDVCVWVIGSVWAGSLMPNGWLWLLITAGLLALYMVPEWIAGGIERRWRRS